MPKFHTRFTPPEVDGIVFTEPSLTEQSFSYETDINNIVMKGVQSSLPLNTQQPIFGSEFSAEKYSESLNIIASAKSKFEQLPSHIRAEFDNNPAKLMSFVQDDKNYDRALELGLVEKKVAEVINPIPVVIQPVEGIVDSSQSTINEASSH